MKDYETKKMFLEARNSILEINRLIDRANMFRSLAYKSTNDFSNAMEKGVNNFSRVATYAAELIDIENECKSKIKSAREKIEKAQRVIDSIEKYRHRELLELRYLNCKKWSEIAKIMGYEDERTVYKTHAYALESATNVFNKNKRRA